MNRRTLFGLLAAPAAFFTGLRRAAADEDDDDRVRVTLSDDVCKWDHSLLPDYRGRDGRIYREAVGQIRYRRPHRGGGCWLPQCLLDDEYRGRLEALGWAMTAGGAVTAPTPREVRVTRLYRQEVL